jgi:hypothetical protein
MLWAEYECVGHRTYKQGCHENCVHAGHAKRNEDEQSKTYYATPDQYRGPVVMEPSLTITMPYYG